MSDIEQKESLEMLGDKLADLRDRMEQVTGLASWRETALALVDEALSSISTGRELITVSEVVDVLLDLRLVIEATGRLEILQ